MKSIELSNEQIFNKVTLKWLRSLFGDVHGCNDQLDDYSVIEIWHDDGKIDCFNGESDEIEIARALNKSDIKVVIYDTGYDACYYGKEKNIICRDMGVDDIERIYTLEQLAKNKNIVVSAVCVDDVIL